VAITTAELLNSHIWASNTAAGVFQNGCLLFVAGLAVVQNHAVRGWQWESIVTGLGWGGMTVGLVRMIAPEGVLESVRRDVLGRGVLGMGASVWLIGVFLTGKGFAWL
jgi:hypothetical protein